MIRYTPTSQLKIEEFKTPFELKLDADNRWVKLGQIIPWDQLAAIYYGNLQSNKGRAAINARIAIGAMVIKHKLNLSDRETVATLQENPYMQYFLGLDQFHPEPLFDASLFVDLRKRMGEDTFDKFNEILIEKAVNKSIPKHVKVKDVAAQEGEYKALGEDDKPETPSDQAEPKPKGKLKLDATVSDIYIKYPTDLDLLNTSREWSEAIIDKLYEKLGWEKKPRTYRRVARKEYLNVAKKKKKSKQEIRRGIKIQLNCLKRNFGYIETMLDEMGMASFPLPFKDQRYYWVIQEVYNQQQEMFKEHKHTCDDRIVSVHQPYVRPIVRGKSKTPVEFGPKLGLSLDNGYTRINTFSWDAYHEGKEDFKKSVEAYRKIHGYYPELVQVDAIYPTRENREWAKERNIRITAKPLGRPQQEQETTYQKRKRKKELAERNHIEGKIGQGKNGYEMNQIRTRLRQTAESWIACIVFVMNLVKMEADLKRKKRNSFWLYIKLLLDSWKQPHFTYVNYVKA
jgi:hypothetical protein